MVFDALTQVPCYNLCRNSGYADHGFPGFLSVPPSRYSEQAKHFRTVESWHYSRQGHKIITSSPKHTDQIWSPPIFYSTVFPEWSGRGVKLLSPGIINTENWSSGCEVGREANKLSPYNITYLENKEHEAKGRSLAAEHTPHYHHNIKLVLQFPVIIMRIRTEEIGL